MRVAALALAVVAGFGCGKRSLQSDVADGGPGSIGLDATGGDDLGPSVSDRGVPLPAIDARPSFDCPAPSTIAGGWVPMDFLVVLDRAPAGDRMAWIQLLDVVIAQMLTARTDWGLYSFPKFGPACSVGTVPPNVDLPVLPDNHQNVAAAVANRLWAGEGMPAAAAIEVGAAHLRTLAPDEPKFLLLVTDRPPTCGGTGDQVAPADPAQAQADTIAAIGRAAAAKIGTIVVAPSTTASSTAAVLDALAEAGGYPRAVGTHKFQDETTLHELFTPPGSWTCKVALKDAPPYREIIGVTFNGAEVPHDIEHKDGWDYVANPAVTTIELYGGWCDQLLGSRRFELKAYYVCML
jgi:hypothetical protein